MKRLIGLYREEKHGALRGMERHDYPSKKALEQDIRANGLRCVKVANQDDIEKVRAKRSYELHEEWEQWIDQCIIAEERMAEAVEQAASLDPTEDAEDQETAITFDIIADEIEHEGAAVGIDDLEIRSGRVWITLHEEDEEFRGAMERRGIDTMRELVEEHVNEELEGRWPWKVALEESGGGYQVKLRPECPVCGEPTDRTGMTDPETGAHAGTWWFCTACDWSADLVDGELVTEEDGGLDETCTRCGEQITSQEAQEVADWLLEESDYTLDEGPHCVTCSVDRRAEGGER